MSDDDLLVWAEEDKDSRETHPSSCWKILVVDDEKSVHDVTRLALGEVQFDGKGLDFISAYSAAEAKAILEREDDIALILLDVIMETDNAGLDVVRYIRNTLKNQNTRIILRTGQPGQVPENKVILEYDINDYKEKTELTAKKLFTTVIAALRAYNDIKRLDRSRAGLERVVSASSKLFTRHSKEEFFSGLLEQVLSIADVDGEAFYVQLIDDDFLLIDPNIVEETGAQVGEMIVAFATPGFSHLVGKPLAKVLDERMAAQLASAQGHDCACTDTTRIFSITPNSQLFLETKAPMDEILSHLIRLYCHNVAIGYHNLCLNQEIMTTQKEIAFTLGETSEFRSKETGAHVQRVAEITALLASLHGMSDYEVELLRSASPLHDIGKIAIPDAVLLKPGRLDEDEMQVMRSHTDLGANLLKHSKRPLLKAAAIIASQHHEKWNGMGYPRQLAGEGIHIYGRIAALADVFDALAHSRCYKPAWPREEIIAYFEKEKGQHFDPHLAELMLSNIDDFFAIIERLPD